MQLHEYTEDALLQLAGSTIYDRGYDYYLNVMVYSLNYNVDTDSIQAEVEENYDDYEVGISMRDDQLAASCTCPYEGWPCKHIVATLLTFLQHKAKYVRRAQKMNKTISSLEKKVKALSKDELVTILLACAKNYPDVKRDLTVRLESNKMTTFTTLKKQVACAFPSIESRNYSPSNIAKQLRSLIKATASSSPEMQIKVYWVITDRILQELNNYGMDEDVLENVAIEAMESLVELFSETEQFQEGKTDIIKQLLSYYHQGNFGITDWVYDTVVGLCSQESDYRIVIQSLEQKAKHTSCGSYYQELIAGLYGAIGNTEAQRKMLEQNLRSGMDYWRLAEYWLDQKNEDKALEVASDGLEKGEGRKIELYDFVQQYYKKQGDYARIFDLLQQKITKQELDNRNHFIHDSTYQCLWEYCSDQGDYQGLQTLLEIRLTNNDMDADFYKQSEEILDENDWQTFEPRIIQNLQERIQQQQRNRTPYLWNVPYAANDAEILAEIFAYKQDSENLFETIRHDIRLLRQYESQLLAEYTVEYLEQYRHVINRLISARGRDNYKTAAGYARTIKHIYKTIQKTPEEWTRYITGLRSEHKRLRALKEEFADL
ncbi:hypothetical protein CSA56_09930 [candidate division KSB3 bacterium]|uniref:SWIM-type domain-containing protein n=1 Tax=candidate division KSB3 bacterium TaxID=2044937 RepID=A0A2G6KDT3_9BACT|nr:MAG: hypothetical protein CSA56_09930 [candidate division KSB3 bacterium]